MAKGKSKVAFWKNIRWMIFSGTAMLSAFILPIHIWAIMNGYVWDTRSVWIEIYFYILFLSAMYHSFYRVGTVFFDLTLKRTSKIVDAVMAGLFIGLAVIIWFYTWGIPKF
jgi:hypothetical protein